VGSVLYSATGLRNANANSVSGKNGSSTRGASAASVRVNACERLCGHVRAHRGARGCRFANWAKVLRRWVRWPGKAQELPTFVRLLAQLSSSRTALAARAEKLAHAGVSMLVVAEVGVDIDAVKPVAHWHFAEHSFVDIAS